MDYSIKQLKLVTGEEVICEILDETPESLAVRNVLALTEKTTSDGYKYFTFRTFMTYQDTPLSVMLIMNDKIMAIAIPSKDMVEQYNIAFDQLTEDLESQAESEEEDNPEFQQSLDDWIDECDKLSLMDSDVSNMTKN